ncbi:MAG TPA: glycosyltransferase [Xanthobacteraceae bacterium]|nr:glycosyltransferase [Xanthobacteraceae bacterium]
MRLLIAPNVANPYDQRMVEGLAAGFRVLGHEAIAVPGPLTEIDAAPVCKQLDLDVLIQVNKFRPLYAALPEKVRHITWFQDVFPETLTDAALIKSTDIVYALGDPKVLGLNTALPCYVGTLLTGIDDSTLAMDHLAADAPIDMSLCGYIPTPYVVHRAPSEDLLWYVYDTLRRIPVLGRMRGIRGILRVLSRTSLPIGYAPYAVTTTLRSTVEALYRPLRGELDIYALERAMREVVAPVLAQQARPKARPRKPAASGRLSLILLPYEKAPHVIQPELESLINWFARDYPRLLDRHLLLQNLLTVSDDLELYGPGWDKHEEFRPYHKGTIVLQSELLQVYRRSRLNLANNTHGLGLHARTLECMAVGGFIFTHTSANDDKPGGLETSFEPGVHYGTYTPDSIADDARRWLGDEQARAVAGKRAAQIIREKHLWRHRAEQILNDLGR